MSEKYASCSDAVHSMKNVTLEKEVCKCDWEPTQFNYVGNGIHYACIDSKLSNGGNVYGRINGKLGRVQTESANANFHKPNT